MGGGGRGVRWEKAGELGCGGICLSASALPCRLPSARPPLPRASLTGINFQLFAFISFHFRRISGVFFSIQKSRRKRVMAYCVAYCALAGLESVEEKKMNLAQRQRDSEQSIEASETSQASYPILQSFVMPLADINAY